MTHASAVDTARCILSALTEGGVTHLLYCPGSRSAPFAYALDKAAELNEADDRGEARAPRVRVLLDERAAGFAAVGIARAGGLPAVITTSGTALLELHAAAAEASHARLPLVIVSADRPAELRGVGASQTTEHVGALAPHVRETWDIPAGSAPSASLRSLIARACARAVGAPSGIPGPAHLNVAFRDPLTPTRPNPSQRDALPATVTDTPNAEETPLPRVHPSHPHPLPWEEIVGYGARGIIIAGDGASPQALEWSQKSGFPLLGEPASGLWEGGGVLPYEQSLIRALGDEVESVVVTGRPTLSRPVHCLLSRSGVRVIVVDPHAQWVDISGNAAQVVAGLEAPTCAPSPDDIAWRSRWERAAHEAGEKIRVLAQTRFGESLTLFDVVQQVSDGKGPLVLGASNPVRAFDLSAPDLSGRAIYSNRGQAGIDGTIATACGISWAHETTSPADEEGSGRTQERMVLVLGDLSTCYDASSLGIAAQWGANLDIVVCDDQGGGIFATLEHGQFPDSYDKWFAVAQNVNFEAMSAAYGVHFARAHDARELREILVAPVRGPRLVHVPIDRAAHLYAQIRDILCN